MNLKKIDLTTDGGRYEVRVTVRDLYDPNFGVTFGQNVEGKQQLRHALVVCMSAAQKFIHNEVK